jgi:5-methylcytosine-specific restriction endonuclease McrA
MAKRRTSVPPEVAEAVIARDQFCQAGPRGFAPNVRCAGRGHIHHRILRSHGGTHTEDNLMLLCDAHHHHAHNVARAEAELCEVIVRRRYVSG